MGGLKIGFSGFPSRDGEKQVKRSLRDIIKNVPMNLYLSADREKDSSMHPEAYKERPDVVGPPWSG